jgi:hypothetical protein
MRNAAGGGGPVALKERRIAVPPSWQIDLRMRIRVINSFQLPAGADNVDSL